VALEYGHTACDFSTSKSASGRGRPGRRILSSTSIPNPSGVDLQVEDPIGGHRPGIAPGRCLHLSLVENPVEQQHCAASLSDSLQSTFGHRSVHPRRIHAAGRSPAVLMLTTPFRWARTGQAATLRAFTLTVVLSKFRFGSESVCRYDGLGPIDATPWVRPTRSAT
jgi:hypothetical protein